MPIYTVEDDFGNTLKLEGDSPPTEQELEEIFSQRYPQQQAKSQPRNSDVGVGEGIFGMKWGSPEMEKFIDDRDRQEQMRRDVGRMYEPGTELAGALAEAIGFQPSTREKDLEEKIAERTIGASPEKADLIRQQETIADEGVPLGWRLGASAHSGLSKGMQLPSTLFHTAFKLSRDLPGSQIAEAARKKLGDFLFEIAIAPEDKARVKSELLDKMPDPSKWNDEYFENVAKWEKRISEQDAQLGGQNFATQLAEGTARGFAELPVQMLGGLSGTAAGNTMRGASIGAGATSGMQRFAQEKGEGSSDFTAATRGATSALITGLTTRAFGTTGIESIFRKQGVSGIVNKIKDSLIHGGYEGVEEATDQLQQELADYIQKNPNKPIGDSVHDVLLSGGVGLILGGGMASVHNIAGGGESNASEVPETATVHGDVRPQAQGQPTMPTAEGGERVQPKAEEVFNLREQAEWARLSKIKPESMIREQRVRFEQLQSKLESAAYAQTEREGMDDETTSLLRDAIESEGQGGRVEVGDLSQSLQGYRALAKWDEVNQKIIVDPAAWKAEMDATPQNKRKERARSLINEEVVHSFTDPKDAENFYNNSSRLERAIGRRIYTGKWGDKEFSGIQIGFEMMRRRVQRINGMTPSEMVAAARSEHWQIQGLEMIERSVAKAREVMGTKASKEQIASIDRTLSNIQKAKTAVAEAGSGDDNQPFAIARTSEVQEFLQDLDKGKAFKSNEEAIQAGLAAESVGDLDALLEARRDIQLKLQEAKSNKDLNAMMGLVGPNQFLREAIETATSSGSHRVDLRKFGEQNLPEPKLDWRKNPEVKRWLQTNGPELGIEVEETHSPFAMTRAAEKRIAKLREERLKQIAESERDELSVDAMTAKIVELSNKQRESNLTENEQEELSALRRARFQRESEQFGPFAIRRGGGTKKSQELAELRRKLMEARGEELPEELRTKGKPASGSEYAPVSPSERVGASESGALPRLTAEDVQAKAEEILQGDIEHTGFKGKLKKEERTTEEIFEQSGKSGMVGGLKPRFERPNFKEFQQWAKNNVDGIQPHQIRAMWEDVVWGQLLTATPERLTEWRQALGLERNYGKATIAGPVSAKEQRQFTLQGLEGDKVKARQNKASMEAGQRYRNKVVMAIAQKLIGESFDDRPSLDRSEVTLDDLDFSNANAKYSPFEEFTAEDIKNPDVLKAVLRDQARASNTDPESASRRLVAVVDKATHKVELLSTYNDAGVQRVTDPAGARLPKKPSRELNAGFLRQYRPIASVLLADPVRAFRKQFGSVSEFNAAIGDDARLRSTVGEHFQEAPTEFQAEGTPGIEGEGGSLIGKHKATSGMSLSRPGALESQSPVTKAEAGQVVNAVWNEVGAFDSPQDVKDALDGLTDKVARKKLTKQERVAISGFRKIYQALAEFAGQEGDGRTPEEIHESIIDEMAGVIFDFNETSNNPGEFSNKITKAFKGEGSEYVKPASPEQLARRSEVRGTTGLVRDLTMLNRRPPTDVQPENLPPGVELVRGREPERPVQRLRYQHEEPTVEEINAERERVSHASKTYELNQLWDELLTADERKQNNRRMLAMKLRQRVYRKQKVLLTADQAMEAAINKTGTPEERANLQADKTEKSFFSGPFAIRRTNKNPSMGEIISNALHDTLSGYDSWMIDRIDDYGGPVAKKVAEIFRGIVDREKELYGGLTPLLDRARKLAGGVEPAINSMLKPGAYLKELPGRVTASIDAQRAVKWLNEVNPITPKAGVARTVRAIEGTIGIPRFAQNIVDAANAANREIGAILQPVIKGFKATGKFQRNLTSMGYDIIRSGGGEMWENWTEALAQANKLNVADVRNHFDEIKANLDDPATNSEVLEKINQDMARRYPKVVTHLKGKLGWQPIVHSDLFNYLENAARRATHVRAFREVFPKTVAGQAAFQTMMKETKKELTPEIVDDLNDVVRAMHGHPTDNYNNRMLSYARMAPQQFGGQVSRMLNTTLNNVLGKAVLSGQMFVQPGEVVAGSTPVFFGYQNYLKAAARYRQLYTQLELTGAVNRVMHDYTYNPTSPVRSAFKIAGNALSKVTAQNALNELQEGMAAATARVVAENISNGNLSDWEKSMLPQTFKIMGFNPGEVQKIMAGDQQLLGQFQRKAAAFLTGGNKSVAEGSSLGSNRLFNSIFRFQTYPMIKMNQAREVLTHWVDAMRTGTGQEKANASRLAGRFFFGNVMQGALTVGLTGLAYGGISGLKIRMKEAEDEPFKFLTEAFLSSISGPAYLLWRGKSQKGIGGYGEQAARLAFPYAVMNDLNDMAMGYGQYKDRPTFQRIGMFLKNKTPATKAIGTGLAMVGLSSQNQKLEESIKALSRWRRDNLGFSESRDYLNEDDRKEFRMHIKEAIDAMKVGDSDKFNKAWMDAAGESDMTKVGQSLKARKVMIGPSGSALTSEQKEALRKHIGEEAYEALEYYDLMLDQAADGVLLPRD